MRKTFLGTILLVIAVSAPSFAADTFSVDSVHSSVLFRVKRFDVVNVYGRFNGLTGTIVFDSSEPGNSSVEFEIKAEAVDTANQRRDDHLRSPDFFDAKQFPVITFKSTRVTPLSEGRFQVTGDLTLHGVTKSIVTEVALVGIGKHPRQGTPVIGFETSFSIQRSDFGMNYMIGALSDEVEIILAVQGVSE